MDCFKLDGLDKAYQILDKPVVPPFVAKKNTNIQITQKVQKYKNTTGKGESRLDVIVVPPSMASEQALHRVPPSWAPSSLFPLHFPQSHPTNTDPSSSISSFFSSPTSPPLTSIVKLCSRLSSFLHVPQARGGGEGGQGRC